MAAVEDLRCRVLVDLLDLRTDLSLAPHAPAEIRWGQEEVVHLAPSHLPGVLRTLSARRLDAAQVDCRADAVEMRDDIGRSPGTEDAVDDALLAMSSPQLAEDLSSAAPRIISGLEGGEA